MTEKLGVRILIIGSGLAGLSAVKSLLQWSPQCNVNILEALPRPGGRVHSVQIKENEFLEEGATWIHGTENNPIPDLIKPSNIHIPTYSLSLEKFCRPTGDEVSLELVESIHRIYHRLKTAATDIYSENSNAIIDSTNSVGEFLQKHFLIELKEMKMSAEDEKIAASIFGNMAQLECCICGCNSLYDLLLKDFGEYEELGGGDKRIVGGYSQVVQALLKKLPTDCVLYNSPVTRIQWKHNQSTTGCCKPVCVSCEDGKQYYADHLIVTQSLGFLKERAKRWFNPSLPDAKLNSISRMGYHYITKIRLLYSKPFWKEDFTEVQLLWDQVPENAVHKASHYTKKTWYKQIYCFSVYPFVSNVLEAWLAGESALHAENLPNEEISQTCTDILRRFLKDTSIPEPEKILKTAWNNNPYFRGAYSYIAVGSSGEDCDCLAEPLYDDGSTEPRVLFAGEATHRTYYSTAHGALLSGEREAKRLINLYNN